MNLLENVFAAGERGNPDETESVSSYGSFPATGAIKTKEDVVKISSQLICLGDKLDKKRRYQYAEWCYTANFIEDEDGPLEGWGAKLICIPFLLQFLWGPEKSPGYYTRSRWSWSDEEWKHVEEPSDWERFSTDENYRDENASGCQLFFEFVRNLLVHGVDYMTTQRDAFAEFWKIAGGRGEPKAKKIRKQVLIWLDSEVGMEAILQKANAIRSSGRELSRALERAPDPCAAAYFREILDNSAVPIQMRTFVATGLLLLLQATTCGRPDEVATKEQKGNLCDGPRRAHTLVYAMVAIPLFDFLEEEGLPCTCSRTERKGASLEWREVGTRMLMEHDTAVASSSWRGSEEQRGQSVANPRNLVTFHGRIRRLALAVISGLSRGHSLPITLFRLQFGIDMSTCARMYYNSFRYYNLFHPAFLMNALGAKYHVS